MTLTQPISQSTIQQILDSTPKSSFINGSFTGGTPGLDVIDPATGRSFAQVVDANPLTAGAAALDAAVAAQREWAASLPRERSELLMRAFDLVHERADALAVLMTLEMGKPLAEAYGEVSYGAEFLRWFAEEAVRIPGTWQQAPQADHVITVSHKPVGPVLAITPWNFPLSMGTRKIAPAIAAGCTVVIKPAAATPLTMLAFMQILQDTGLPDGVVNCVVTSGTSELSSSLLADPRLRKLSFTGSTDVGRSLLELVAPQVLKSSMELGGNAPFLVLPSADLDTAVNAIMPAKFRNNGEACTAANRIYVHASLAEEFTRRLVAKAEELQVGAGIDAGTTLGPLINEDAVAKVEELVQDAVDKGAAVLTGGTRLDRDGFFFAPTVLGDVPRSARVNREEIFGPVAPVIVMDDVDSMITAANDTEFGLMSYVIAEDQAEIDRVAGRIESGMLAVNVGVASDASAPFGGVKASGLGREGASAGILEYLEPFYVRRPRAAAD